jgi:aspartate kinase
MKFGGSSLSDGGEIRRVAELTSNYLKKDVTPILVASAMSGVTDDLINITEVAARGRRKTIEDFLEIFCNRHMTALSKSIHRKKVQSKTASDVQQELETLGQILTGISYLREVTPRSRDYVLSFGERISSRILTGTLVDLGLKSKYFTGGEAGILTDDNYGSARPLLKTTTQQIKGRINSLPDKGIIPVITGFIGETQNGVTTTLGRGGSDYTSTIVGAAVGADEVWIWTDVDGLMTADPKLVPDAKTIQEISFPEAMEMVHFGAKNMHPKALEPAQDHNLPVRIKNASNPDHPGTLICSRETSPTENIVKAISIIRDAALVTVAGAGVVGTPDIVAEVFSLVGSLGVDVYMVSQGSSEANISFAIPRNLLDKTVNLLEMRLLGDDVRSITPEDDVSIIAVIGAGMKGTPGVAARVFQSVAGKNVNVRMIAQGSSELNISFVVKETDISTAAQVLHSEFKLIENFS